MYQGDKETLIKEIIVVEGKDDASAVKKACRAEVIITNGLGITKETIERIGNAQQRCGVIVLTDPDFPGEKIRHIIDQAVPGCRHAFISQADRDKVGVEYAAPEEIREALARACVSEVNLKPAFEMEDLYQNNLVGRADSKARRYEAGRRLGLGETNAKQFLRRLNSYQISKEGFNEVMAVLSRSEE